MSRNCWRVMSPLVASSLTTSAPSQARICVHEGPDCTWVMSSTRTPSRAFSMAPPLERRQWLAGRSMRPANQSVYLYMVWFSVPGAYASGSIQTLISEGRPDWRARSLAGRFALLLAASTEHLGELAEADVRERVADAAAIGAVLLLLAVPDLVHRGVVADDSDERQVEAHQGVEVEAGQSEGPVAEQGDNLLLRKRLLGSHHERNADADVAQCARTK